jgi:molybdate-binding protein/predicted nucleic acid-binding protein
MAADAKTRQPRVRVLLDAAFCLSLIRTRTRRPLPLFQEHTPGEIGISAITVAALQARAAQTSAAEQNRRALEQFLLPLVVVDFDADAARMLAEQAGWWPSAGGGAAEAQVVEAQMVEAQMVAAQAQRLRARLVTSRPDLYPVIPGLQLDTTYADVPPAAVTNAGAPTSAAPRLARAAGVIVAVGSHDMTLDLLGDTLHAQNPAVTLVSAHVGSLQGLLALQRNEAHVAGTHLLDSETGAYNLTYVDRLLTAHGVAAVVVAFVSRIQGFIVARGNPKAIHTVADLARPDVRFVNRQAGAGTRVLLDYELALAGIAPTDVSGYDHVEGSHMGITATVAGGNADCGMGIEAAARARGLDFVPLVEERYDLVIPRVHYESPLLAPLVSLLRRPGADFLAQVAALGGYNTDGMGEILAG